ncbi:MAG TPA: YitT family protein [Clostridiales bacterium]|nr:YitT family protein [Clostridiales bacterium]
MTKSRTVNEYLLIILGCLLTALSFNFFFIPNEIAPGGLSGLATVIYYLFGFPVGVTTLVLNIPLFIAGIRQLGGHFGLRTLIATILLSVFIDLIKVPALTNDMLLASIYGGFLMGIGLGLIFRMNATTGGTDLFAKIIHKFFPAISVAWVLFAVDFLVVLAAAVLLGPNQGLYAVVALALAAKVIDLVQEGLNSAKAVFVISDHSEAISQRIMKEMDRGATLLDGRGAYTGKEKSVLLCVVSRTQIVQVKNLINEIDPKAFVLVADVKEVMGEGFTSASNP